MPILFLAAAALGLFLFEHQKRTSVVPSYDGHLLPGAQPYMPPIAAPDDVRIAYANAMYRKNPIELVQVAQQIMAQYPQYGMLAQQLSAQYQQLTNNPIPGVPAGASPAAAAGALQTLIGALPPQQRQRLLANHRMRKQQRRAELMRRLHAAKHARNV